VDQEEQVLANSYYRISQYFMQVVEEVVAGAITRRSTVGGWRRRRTEVVH
jgi:hypothetical protein